jgi:hypothetical protein
MTAKQIMDFADKHAKDTFNFCFIKEALIYERDKLLVKLECTPFNKRLKNKLQEVNEKIRMLNIMYNQRLELYNQAKK